MSTETEDKGQKPENSKFEACSNCLLTQLSKLGEMVIVKKPFYKRRPIIFSLLIIFALIIIYQIGKFALKDDYDDEDAFSSSSKRIAIVRVEGVILDNKQILGWIEKVKRNKKVKGVLLRIDSPGGGAAASQEIYEALQNLAKVKPVVASMGSVAASGGLMVSLAAKHIVANASTITGSIGVKMTLPQVHALMDKIGVGQESLTSGKYKDSGSPFKPLTADDKKYFGGLINDMYEQFVEMIAIGRDLSIEKVRPMADGRAFTGREALKLGLVDELGGQDVAFRHLLTLCDADPNASPLEQPKPKDIWNVLAKTVLDLNLSTRDSAPEFMFLF